ncbi:hypothetical protein AV530_008070 [Patagioenas fasciata monilis]|uniref:Uncharacterized protein n=1 Tax=Patagioenas fasciata monilis TaxID=372326 RepID=A0A1V4KU76_PATFA|nr:hypothetical protein AV530_008070 [Patagioenas fasciata monilis]
MTHISQPSAPGCPLPKSREAERTTLNFPQGEPQQQRRGLRGFLLWHMAFAPSLNTAGQAFACPGFFPGGWVDWQVGWSSTGVNCWSRSPCDAQPPLRAPHRPALGAEACGHPALHAPRWPWSASPDSSG